MLLTIIGYHTCKDEGGWSFVRVAAPFISEDNPRQWLTQGYYFWTGVPYYATKWGEQEYPNSYAIVKCKIEIDDGLLLNLVDSPDDQDFFEARMTKYRDKLIKDGKNQNECTVSTCLAWMRKLAKGNSEFFPWVAVKAQDTPSGKTFLFRESKRESMPVRTRQQICVYASGLNCIVEKEIVYPDDYVKQSTPVVLRK